MNLTVTPASSLRGSLNLPASKSYTIRAFLIAACGGYSTIKFPSDCDDAKVARRIAQQLGAKIHFAKENVYSVEAKGVHPRGRIFRVQESGTVLRFLLPLLAFQGQSFIVTGSKTLVGRPNHLLLKTLRSMGSCIKGVGPRESVPIAIQESCLKKSVVKIDGSKSSQYISALLIASALWGRKVTIEVTGPQPVSLTYLTMTEQILKRTGIRFIKKGKRRYHIAPYQKFEGLGTFRVPSDWGLAAFFLVAGVLVKSRLTMKGNFDKRFIQADGAILHCLRKMGIFLKVTSRSVKINGPQELTGGEFCLKDAPDLVPIMTIASLFAKKATRLHGIGHVRLKESNRITDLRKELAKIGACIKESRDSLTIFPKENYKSNCLLDSHKDHRLAMAFAILGLKIKTRVKDMGCCRKSYPDFVEHLKKIRA